MRLSSRRSAALSALLALATLAVAIEPRPAAGDRAAVEAAAFVRSLAETQRARACFEFDVAERLDWAFVPKERHGLPFADMQAAQRTAFRGLLRATLSEHGVERVDGLLRLEAILRELESRPGAPALGRDPERYYVSIFGQPEHGALWGWRLEGHHLALNFSSTQGSIEAVTPAFLGANPARVEKGPYSGMRLLGPEEDLARALARGLDDEQRSVGLIETGVPADILLGPQRRAELLEPRGIGSAALAPEQRALLRELVEAWIVHFTDAAAAAMRERWLGAEDEVELHFLWIGGLERGEPHYFRVQGSRFVIEYDNVQNGANHAHFLLRDLERDFGADLLAEHHTREHGR